MARLDELRSAGSLPFGTVHVRGSNGTRRNHSIVRIENRHSAAVDTPGAEGLMLRRALVVTAIAVALSAAGALAFVPGFSRVSHAWSRGSLWSGHGFTPVPPSQDSRPADDLLLQNEGGVPGTYCPIPPRSSTPAVTPDQRASSQAPLNSGASTAPEGKTDLFLNPPVANCTVPPTATPAPRPILP
jgi:hypothetical protein